MAVYTIGFTKKSAEKFFEVLRTEKIDMLIDIRLKNTSQLAGFAKHPDIKYFLRQMKICNYIHDLNFAPSEKTLKEYKSKLINWESYTEQFEETMKQRDIRKYISEKYADYKDKNICLLCSEESHVNCHKSLVAEYFRDIFNIPIKNL